eukprot:PRCOL_00001767-RA
MPYMQRAQIDVLERAFPGGVECYDAALSVATAPLVSLSHGGRGANAVCLFVNDDAGAGSIHALADNGIRHIAMRCAGYDRVDLDACEQRGISVTRVPAYSPHAIAEHAVALMLALNRQLVKASMRVIQGNYSLSGLVGFNMHGKTVGVIGTGKIGRCTIDILLGMGCRVLAHDLYPNEEMLSKGVEYLSLEELLPQSDIVTLHCPLNSTTQHLMNENRLSQMKHGAMLINTSRGALVETHALDKALERRQVGSVGMDVYENESGLFFTDTSQFTDNMPGASLPHLGAWDYALHSLAARPNVLVTPHQAFLTQEALQNIADTTVLNLNEFASGVESYTNGVTSH